MIELCARYIVCHKPTVRTMDGSDWPLPFPKEKLDYQLDGVEGKEATNLEGLILTRSANYSYLENDAHRALIKQEPDGQGS